MQCQKTQLKFGTAVRATPLKSVWLLRMDAEQHLAVGTIFAVGALCRHSFGLTRNVFCYTRRSPGPVAQLVEQRIENPRVTGSIPVQATTYKA